MKKPFKNPTEVFEEQLNSIFTKNEETSNNVIMKTLSIIIFSNSNNRDLIDLYNTVDLDTFVSVVSLFEERTVYFPNKEEIKDNILLSLIYYYREVKNLSWKEIEGKVPFEFSTISYSMKIKNLNKSIKNHLDLILKENENE